MKKLEIAKQQADVEMLQRVQIIGMTTTGVAKNQKKIAAVAPRVVICEEAGEVLEAQLMTCLSPACQQLVLIGDHKQLRPHIADYNLSVESAIGKRFALDVSLFERLVAPASGLPFWMLTEQHRMRPQISQLLRMLFYPEVRDASETKEYPPLLGVDKNVFFVNHNHPEDGASGVLGASARSHSNAYEVAYLVATLSIIQTTTASPQIRKRLHCVRLMADAYVPVECVSLVVATCARSCVTLTKPPTLLCTAHSRAHDCRTAADMYVQEFAEIPVVYVKWKSAQSYFHVAMNTRMLGATKASRQGSWNVKN
ncbi:hypothetical protein BBJ29_003229 [Phytophthora kernoviae]|uniref:DNA2/NAM7 helicase helicase domain-containing protein n=1 Tax=Phytophthora kernoviae TaxID=325452 RepID=A0A3R7KAL8_9STRA|nr:hypothetical protein BBJ29_003229 [Phytophthora kernoviae]